MTSKDFLFGALVTSATGFIPTLALATSAAGASGPIILGPIMGGLLVAVITSSTAIYVKSRQNSRRELEKSVFGRILDSSERKDKELRDKYQTAKIVAKLERKEKQAELAAEEKELKKKKKEEYKRKTEEEKTMPKAKKKAKRRARADSIYQTRHGESLEASAYKYEKEKAKEAIQHAATIIEELQEPKKLEAEKNERAERENPVTSYPGLEKIDKEDNKRNFRKKVADLPLKVTLSAVKFLNTLAVEIPKASIPNVATDTKPAFGEIQDNVPPHSAGSAKPPSPTSKQPELHLATEQPSIASPSN
ncbi:hypothetical protein TWF730_005876 [Orbilia blumenaviensis]|uniref:Uncharacterized protein n=1 Tax=Orbilia blumenaviensis TaxID=1796055 RepID=A0AAV9VQV0_9PEZI